MFHISRKDLGGEVTLTPKIPANMLLKVQECDTQRVCFSPTIQQCLVGIIGYEISWEATLLEAWIKSSNHIYTVYQTVEDLTPAPSLEGSDYHLTQEHWSLNPIAVTRLGFINNIDFETFKRCELLPHPLVLSQTDRDAGYAKLTEEQNDLLEKWYSHDFMRDPNDKKQRKEFVTEEDILAAFTRAIEHVSKGDLI
jgi:hypothetical protein